MCALGIALTPQALAALFHRSEADNQAASLRSQAAAHEERLAAQHACRMAQLQSELDVQAAAAADTDADLAAARAQVEHLTAQVRLAMQG